MKDLNGLSVDGAVWRFAMSNVLSLSRDRIFTKGLNSKGEQIGEYADVSIRKKKDKGRFTSRKVNLRDTETLVNSYIVTRKGKQWQIGFTSGSREGDEGQSVSNTEVIKKLEEQYGDDLFGATDEELALIPELIGDYLDLNF